MAQRQKHNNRNELKDRAQAKAFGDPQQCLAKNRFSNVYYIDGKVVEWGISAHESKLHHFSRELECLANCKQIATN